MTDDERVQRFSPWQKNPDGAEAELTSERLEELVVRAEYLAAMDKLARTPPDGNA